MQIKLFTVQACCGTYANVYRLDRPISQALLNFLIQNNYQELAHFTSQGILYVQDTNLIITGPIGSDHLNVKCRNKNCTEKLNDFEGLLKNFV